VAGTLAFFGPIQNRGVTYWSYGGSSSNGPKRWEEVEPHGPKQLSQLAGKNMVNKSGIYETLRRSVGTSGREDDPTACWAAPE